MLDIGATELLLIAVIGLIVVGPEKLPRIARGAGIWINRARRQLSDIQSDVNKELELEDLKKEMEKQKEIINIGELTQEEPDKNNTSQIFTKKESK